MTARVVVHPKMQRCLMRGSVVCCLDRFRSDMGAGVGVFAFFKRFCSLSITRTLFRVINSLLHMTAAPSVRPDDGEARV